MKNVFSLILCFCASALFAQNGLFLQSEVGGGYGNIDWKHNPPSMAGAQHDIFSYQGTLEIGYRARRWEFVSGIGYFRTGNAGLPAGLTWQLYNGMPNGATIFDYPDPGTTTVYNPHIIVPLKVGYRIPLTKRWTFVPYIGAEVSYNMPREFALVFVETELAQHFNSVCNRFGAFGLAQLNFEYKAGKHIDLIGGLSGHYYLSAFMKSPSVYSPQEHDYAALVNLGIRYNFGHIAAKK